ncbi:hypothetical protein [Paenibacillus sp. FSL M7-0896]|uniref:hypothetical protein n=1 Tax=Paenibacillus sp. FSL M7-0896 TaxID=2921610 RepID=UPI0030D7C171
MKILRMFRARRQLDRLEHAANQYKEVRKAAENNDIRRLLDLKQSGYGRKGADPHANR